MPIIDRDTRRISDAFTDIMKHQVFTISKSLGGLDNSVYYIHLSDTGNPQYVLKVIESKPDEQIQEAIILNNSLREFTKLNFHEDERGNYLHSSEHLDKKFVIMNFLSGRHPELSSSDDSQAVALFAARLHNSMTREVVSPKELLQEEVNLISTYYSGELVRSMERVEGEQSMWYKKRASIYRSCNAILNNLLATRCSEFDAADYYITRGITHGDLNSGNMMIGEDNSLSFIDPDAIERDGFQISDVFHAVAKSDIVTNPEKTDEFFDSYLREKGDCNVSREMLHTLLFCLSFRAALSTDYYTSGVGTIPKISTEWVYDNARDTLDKLSITLRSSAKALGMNVVTRDNPETFHRDR